MHSPSSPAGSTALIHEWQGTVTATLSISVTISCFYIQPQIWGEQSVVRPSVSILDSKNVITTEYACKENIQNLKTRFKGLAI